MIRDIIRLCLRWVLVLPLALLSFPFLLIGVVGEYSHRLGDYILGYGESINRYFLTEF